MSELVLRDLYVVDVVSGRHGPAEIVVDVSRGIIGSIDPPGSHDGSTRPVVDCAGAYVLPGFVDAHAHLIYRDLRNTYEMDLLKSPAEAAVDAVYNAGLLLRAGFTTIRDMGSRANIGVIVRDAIARGDVPGPTVRAAGQVVSSAGGMGDMHPRHLFAENPYPSSLFALPASPWEARSVVRRQVSDQVDWIKIALSGTGVSARCAPERDGMSDEEFTAAVREASEQGVPVAVHAESVTATRRAVAQGVASIEHGIHIDAEMADEMRRKDMTLVPTLACYTCFGRDGLKHGRAPYIVETHQRVHGDHVRSVRTAALAGVRIAVGGDAGGAHFPQGSARREAVELCDEAGLSAADALRALTVNGAELLGMDGSIGSIAPGKRADLVFLDADPLADIHVLAAEESVRSVMQSGHFVPGGSIRPDQR